MAIEITDEVVYGTVGDRPLLATLYRPEVSHDQARPAVLWIHGGAWRSGTRHDDAALCRAIAARGFVCLSIDYRLSGEAIFPAAIQDCKCAVRYLRAKAAELGVDAGRIAAWGPSAGGHLAALLGTSAGAAEFEGEGGWSAYSSDVQAVCDWFGPTDFLQMANFPSTIDHNAADAAESLFIGVAVQAHPERSQRANPIRYVSDSTPPMIIAHGKQDQLVPFNQSELLVEALRAQGREVIFEVLEAAGHGGAGFEADGALFKRCLDFLQQHPSA